MAWNILSWLLVTASSMFYLPGNEEMGFWAGAKEIKSPTCLTKSRHGDLNHLSQHDVSERQKLGGEGEPDPPHADPPPHTHFPSGVLVKSLRLGIISWAWGVPRCLTAPTWALRSSLIPAGIGQTKATACADLHQLMVANVTVTPAECKLSQPAPGMNQAIHLNGVLTEPEGPL
ncbi:hypothetical protein KIL84_002278 [Mauremys mutica]|uniref:Uncharacterized protein n=1 Tax=Mauremys mutica TaxID=74926 RepID=A0A9D4AY16_9SAUR|nr:hypothetical protein KIL84_002278 [Mauremys mutica]